MEFSKLLYNQSGRLRTIFKLLSFLLLFQLIGIFLIKLIVPLFNDNAFYLSFMVNVLSCIAVLIALYIFSKYLDRSSMARYGLYPGTQTLLLIVRGAMLAFGVAVLLIIIQIAQAIIVYNPGSIYEGYGLLSAFLSQVLRYLSGAIFEEVLATAFLFVLVVYGIPKRTQFHKNREWIAIVISAIVFGLIHSSNANATYLGIINLVLFGAITTVNFARTRNLAFAIGFHALWNISQNILIGLPNSGKPPEVWIFKTTLNSSDLISGGAFGLEGSLLCTFLFLSLLIYELNKFKIQKQQNEV